MVICKSDLIEQINAAKQQKKTDILVGIELLAISCKMASYSIITPTFSCLKKSSVSSLFDWKFGKKPADPKPSPIYHDVDLPFSPSLLDKTFLRGTCLFRISSSRT